MTRSQLVRQLAESATRPLGPEARTPGADPNAHAVAGKDLFVWFEDTSARAGEGARGIAGLPESLLPCDRSVRVVERRYAEDHFHLLSAVRLRCSDDTAELISAIYTSALSVGTVAWIGTGAQYAHAWDDLSPTPAAGNG